MTTITADAAATPPATTPTDLPVSDRNRILIYLGVLVFMLGFGAPVWRPDRPADQLLPQEQAALERRTRSPTSWLLAGIPLYLGFLLRLRPRHLEPVRACATAAT